jgi:hypothetical protein
MDVLTPYPDDQIITQEKMTIKMSLSSQTNYSYVPQKYR